MNSNNIPKTLEMHQQQMPPISSEYIPMASGGQHLPRFPFPTAQNTTVCNPANTYPAFGTFGAMLNGPASMQMSPPNFTVNSPESIQMSQAMQMGSSPQNLNVNSGQGIPMTHGLQMQGGAPNFNVNRPQFNSSQPTPVPFQAQVS